MANKNKVTVITLEPFQDKFDHKTQYPAGTELQVDEERAKDLVGRGLAKLKEADQKAPKEPKRPEPVNQEKTETISESSVAAEDSANPEKKKEDECQRTEKQ